MQLEGARFQCRAREAVPDERPALDAVPASPYGDRVNWGDEAGVSAVGGRGTRVNGRKSMMVLAGALCLTGIMSAEAGAETGAVAQKAPPDGGISSINTGGT